MGSEMCIRDSTMAARHCGIDNIPANSLIELTHYLADFLLPVYKLIKEQIVSSKYLRADETTHRMLEGDDKKKWYLWGFSSEDSCYFELHNTRAGKVAWQLLTDSQCEYLLTDVFSGYNKAITEINSEREKEGLTLIENPNCNAHSRRYFNEMADEELSQYFIDQYACIYTIEAKAKTCKPDEKLELRQKAKPIFLDMKKKADKLVDSYSLRSSEAKALGYFSKNFANLTIFLDDANIEIDNNIQESLFRSPVIGRKTWSGTHSKRGAKTAAILFSIVETCKLNKINPRRYLELLISDMHSGKPAYTPAHSTLMSKNQGVHKQGDSPEVL